MNFAGFIFFSTLENIAFFYYMLVLFRFHIKENALKFLAFSLILSFVSNTFQTESMQAISPVIMTIIIIVFVAFLLRVHLFNSMIMVVTTYVVNYMVQWMIVGTTLHFSGLKEIVPYTNTAFAIQTASSTMMCAFATITLIQKGGFSFINHNSKLKRTKYFVKGNRSLILFFTYSILVIFFAQFLFIVSKHPPYLAVSIILLLSLIGLLYVCMKRDGSDDG